MSLSNNMEFFHFRAKMRLNHSEFSTLCAHMRTQDFPAHSSLLVNLALSLQLFQPYQGHLELQLRGKVVIWVKLPV